MTIVSPCTWSCVHICACVSTKYVCLRVKDGGREREYLYVRILRLLKENTEERCKKNWGLIDVMRKRERERLYCEVVDGGGGPLLVSFGLESTDPKYPIFPQ